MKMLNSCAKTAVQSSPAHVSAHYGLDPDLLKTTASLSSLSLGFLGECSKKKLKIYRGNWKCNIKQVSSDLGTWVIRTHNH